MVGRLAILCLGLAGCGAKALAHPDGATSTPDVASDSGFALPELRSIVGTMAFNEPMNDGFDPSLVPTWSSAGVHATDEGHLTGTISTSYAGTAPTADGRRDVLFWNVMGQYPSGQDAHDLPLSEIRGVVASSSDERSAAFSLDGSFDPTVVSSDGQRPFELDVGLTWVRATRTHGVVSYQVLPGWRQAFDAAHALTWDGPLTRLDGPFGYYSPLSNDTPGLGADFDYPAWFRAHVTW